jgi:hydroxyquinol 1,2-dioxygenase
MNDENINAVTALITAKTVRSFDGTDSDRLRQIMQSLVTHLHAFVKDVSLTEDEWAAAIDVLTATGDITDAHRQEFILWSDTLGVSMLVDALAHPTPSGATESTILGPFYVADSPVRPLGSDIAEQEAGTRAWVHGRILSTSGAPIPAAELDVWQNGNNQLYAVQDPDAPDDHLRGKFVTDENGEFFFSAVRPVPYPIPDDGPVGRMLADTGRHPWRPAHVHVVVRAPGYATLTTHIFDSTSRYLNDDTVFAVKESLVKEFIEHDGGEPDSPFPGADPWASLQMDIILNPAADESPTVVNRGRTH